MKPSKAEPRVLWLLTTIADTRRRGFMVAWDEDVVDAFVEDFPESKRTLKIYTQGPDSCPMLNRTAAIAKGRGLIKPGHVGNQDARSFNQRTWVRVWTITDEGQRYLAKNGAANFSLGRLETEGVGG